MKSIKVDREYIEIYPVNWGIILQRTVNKIFSTQSFNEIKDISLYVHIPFCPTICPFCKFNIAKYDSLIYKDYIEALKKEILLYRNHPDLKDRQVTAIYFGGGTGSMLNPKEVEEILSLMNKVFPISKEAEVTVECHPSTVNSQKLRDYKKAGINRVSLGIQSFQDQNLKTIGRTHTASFNEKILKAALKTGFNCVVMDLMYRLPNQTLENLEFDLKKIKEFSPDGISAYSLEPEVTPLQKRVLEIPSEDIDKKMFYFVGDFLENVGYRRFMQPDFSKPGKECKYVLNSWKAPQQLMLGFGAGAHTHYFGGHVWANVYPVESYLKAINDRYFPGVMGINIPIDELIAKYMVLGVRGIKVDKIKFKKLFKKDIIGKFGKKIKKLEQLGWLKDTKDRIKVTKEGLYYIDNISKFFYTAKNKNQGQPWLKNLYTFTPKNFYKKPRIIKPI